MMTARSCHTSAPCGFDPPREPTEPTARIDAFFADVAAGYSASDRLTKTLERVPRQGVEGIVVFCAGGLTQARLWETVRDSSGR